MKIRILILFLILILLSLPFKILIAEEKEPFHFYLKDEISKVKSPIDVGKGKFENYFYIFSRDKNDFSLFLKGNGPVSFIILFDGFSKVFPEKNEILNSPFLILKGNLKTFMFSVSPYERNYWEVKEGDKGVYIIYNIYLKKERWVNFKIFEVSGIRDGIERYHKLYKVEGSKLDGGTLYPDSSLTKLRNAGIYDFNLSLRIVDPLSENNITRIFECKNFNIKPFILFNPFKYSFITEKELSVKELYFSKDYVKKNFSTAILTSGIRDANGNIKGLLKKAEPILRIEREVKGKAVVVKEIPDKREGMLEETFFLYPNKNFLKNRGISAYETNYFYNIFYLDIGLNAENRKRNLVGDNRANYFGYAVDLSDTSIFDYDTSHSKYNNLLFKDKPTVYFPFEILSFIEEERKNSYILVINPSIFQIGFNSDVVVKRIPDLSYLKDLPLIRAVYNKKVLVLSLAIPTEKINEELIDKFFRKSLLFGIYPTFAKSRTDAYSLWDKQELVNMVKPYFSRYVPLIREINKREWKPKTFARISDGETERFGDYPDIVFTIDGSGYLEIDKESLNIDDDYKVFDLEVNKPLKTSEENGKIYVKLDGAKVVRVFKNEKHIVSSSNSNFKEGEKKSFFYLFIFLPLFFIPILFKNFVINKPSLKITLPLLVFLSFLIRRVFFISSPPFIFLILSFMHYLSSLYFAHRKREIFFLSSIYFFFIFLLFTLINKGFMVNPFPPFYFPMDLYFFTIFLSLFLIITTMYRTKRKVNFFIIIVFILFFILSDITTFPFFSPPFDTTFFITMVLMGLILFILCREKIHFLLTSLYFIPIIIYPFWDKINFYLLNHKLFPPKDFLPSIIISIFALLYILFTENRDFIKYPDGFYTTFLIAISLISILFQFIYLKNPSAIGAFLWIVKVVIYAFLILFLIYIFEVLFSRREE